MTAETKELLTATAIWAPIIIGVLVVVVIVMFFLEILCVKYDDS